MICSTVELHPQRNRESQRRESSPRRRGYEPRALARGRCVRDRVRTPPGNRTPPMGFGNPARRQPEQCMDVALRRRMRASVVVPLEGLEPSPATFVASCPILGTVADVRGLLTAFVRVVAGKASPRAVTGSRRRWRPHRRGQARRPLTRTGHLRGGAPGASLTRSPECRYLRPVIVTVTDVYRPERSASPPIIARSGGIEPTISGWRDRRTDHCPTSAKSRISGSRHATRPTVTHHPTVPWTAVSEGGPGGGMTPPGEGLATNLPVIQRARRDSNPQPAG